MTLGYSAEQVRAAEAVHLARREPLMQRAASGLAREIRGVLAGRPARSHAGRVLVLVGSGDNGGDALFAAAALASSGTTVHLVRTGSRCHRNGYAVALDAGCDEIPRADLARITATARAADVIVDGILGTGASGDDPALRGTARDVVRALLPLLDEPGRPEVVAVDLPSGVHPDDGSIPDPAVLRADVTVTFGGIKAGLLRGPGEDAAGRIRLVDIGIGAELAAVDPVVRR